MTRFTTLLVARDPAVINDIQRLHDETEDARLEVCGRLDKVLSRLGNRSLLLIHFEPGSDPATMQGLLGAATRSMATTIVLLGPAPATSPADLSPSQTYRLPCDLPALRDLLARVHAGAPVTPPAEPTEPVDALTAARSTCTPVPGGGSPRTWWSTAGRCPGN
jgi:hypothetical protein